MDKILYWIKGFAGFALTVLTNLAVNFQTTGTPIPQDWSGWAVLIGTTALTTAGVVLPRNKQTPVQVETSIKKDLSPTQRRAVAAKILAVPPHAAQ